MHKPKVGSQSNLIDIGESLSIHALREGYESVQRATQHPIINNSQPNATPAKADQDNSTRIHRTLFWNAPETRPQNSETRPWASDRPDDNSKNKGKCHGGRSTGDKKKSHGQGGNLYEPGCGDQKERQRFEVVYSHAERGQRRVVATGREWPGALYRDCERREIDGVSQSGLGKRKSMNAARRVLSINAEREGKNKKHITHIPATPERKADDKE